MKRKAQRGLTLVELVIALAVIALTLLQAIQVMVHTSVMKQATREFTVAREAAMSKLEEIKTYPQNNNWAGVATFNVAPKNSFTVAGLNSGLGSIVIDTSNQNLYQVTVTVTWRGVKGPANYTTSVMLTR